MNETEVRLIDGRRLRSFGAKKSWAALSRLGSGGQGDAFLCRRVADSAATRQAFKAVVENLAAKSVHIGADYRARTVEEVTDLLCQAVSSLLDAEVAHASFVLKTYRDRGDAEQARKRVQREIEVLSNLDHPGIIKIVDHGTCEDGSSSFPWAVFPFVSGGTLRGNVERFRGNPIASLEVVRSVLQSLEFLHGHDDRIVHRDVKPENVFLTENGAPVLGDFGLVKAEDQSTATRTGEEVGAWQFYPDWRHLGGAEDRGPLDDLYAVGKTLWCMVSGRAELRREWWDQDQYRLDLLFPDTIGMVEVNSILQKIVVDQESKAGYGSASEMREDVESVLAGLRRNLRPYPAAPSACIVCLTGKYEVMRNPTLDWVSTLAAHGKDDHLKAFERIQGVKAYRCTDCGNLQVFARPHRSEASNRRHS